MPDSLKKILLPPNSRRRLLVDLISRAVAQPRDFFRYVNFSSLRYFLNYLRNTDPELVGKMVDEVLARDRMQGDKAAQINHHFLQVVAGESSRSKCVPRSTQVDIIIPIFNAPDLTAACIASVLNNSENCRVLIVDDASTDPLVAGVIAALQAVPERGIELVTHRNESNLGFVRTVNHAVAMTSNHFVILNSDTEVPPGWLDRLFAPIFAGPDRVASVTPFSNAAMACSFPVPDRDNQLFKGLTVAELDGYFRLFGTDEPIELFSGVGFCMAFNRRVVERIGMFDAETFGRGYGEETDWSLRAYDAGFSNVLAANLFVYHKHGASFAADEKARLLEANQDLLWKRHGRHMPRLRAMVSQDAPRAIRETIMVGIDARTKNQLRVAILDVDIPGGGTVYSAKLSEELQRASMEVVHYRFNHRQKYLKMQLSSDAASLSLVLPPDSVGEFPGFLSFCGIDVIVVNELFSWPEILKIMGWLVSGQLPYLVMSHDFFMLCPSWFLLDKNGKFCKVPDNMSPCESCLPANSQSMHREFYGTCLDNPGVWRAKAGEFLAKARAVIYFSNTTLDYFKRVYPQLTNHFLNEHPIPNAERFIWKERRYDGDGILHLAVIGHLFPVKGERIIKEMIESERFKSLPVSLQVFGESPLYPPGHVSSDGRVSFLGSYRQEALPQLLEQHVIHAVLLPSICPETFSYTTSEAILLGFPVICFNLGAQAERVRQHKCGLIVDDVSAEALLNAVEHLLGNPALVAEFSKNCRQYVPARGEAHYDAIVSLIKNNAAIAKIVESCPV
ncbi:glycosyltransferase [Geobacter pelophilus]|uniref:Glycosyltransferase n=2 Tax=Geoanaerobacter pelophilus TaxID=60036 RepID=A0AAW4LE53_9BACT|nr:glycosyltransferase [Geoanaerobacter pelophilus]